MPRRIRRPEDRSLSTEAADQPADAPDVDTATDEPNAVPRAEAALEEDPARAGAEAVAPAPAGDRMRELARAVGLERGDGAAESEGTAPQPALEETEQPTIPDVIPALTSGGSVLYPGIVVPYVSAETADVEAINAAVQSPSRMVGVFPQELDAEGGPTGTLRPMGTVATVLRMARGGGGGVQAIIQGVQRVKLLGVEQQQPYYRVRIEPVTERIEPTPEVEALLRNVLGLVQRVIALNEAVPNELALAIANINNPSNLADFIAANLPFRPEERFTVLQQLDVTERLRYVNELLAKEVEVLEIGQQIRGQVQGEMDKRQREFILREQLRAIQKELGDEEQPELAELRRRLDEANLPEEVRKEADRELERLGTIPQASPEYQVARTYLEWIADLPWTKSTEDTIDIQRAEEILNEDHYGLEKVKQRILDYLAVRKLRNDTRGPILCFVGPPGVGKTSLGQSIARAVGRHFVRLSLGGVRDEAEIRGHRRTYVGALPGRILQEIRRAGTNNPVMMLDEIDKLGADFRGDPASALLEVLDPAQNSTFRDHYLDLPFDLSKVMFITTANQLDPIPAPLRDRMEIIEIPGYTEREKIEIARRYLLPRQLRENGLQPGQVQVDDETLGALIRGYTREAGVRNLERLLGQLCRRVAREVAVTPDYQRTVTANDLPELLGKRPLPEELVAEKDEIGVATGMAATSVGGDVLFIEATAIPGNGKFTVTGQLGDVMKESSQAAYTYARLRAPEFGVDKKYFNEHDLHVHVPAGAIPKDGPSAGVTMATALVSAITRRPVRKDVSMTGEITLRGKVLPVGGIKEKVLAAHRAGVKTVVLPEDNARDLDDVPEDVRADLKFVLAEHVDDVLNTALHPERRKEPDRLSPALKDAARGNGARRESPVRTARAAGGRRGEQSRAARGRAS
jgi:ATP-dependent Lon protease